jgi:hypothetical protein
MFSTLAVVKRETPARCLQILTHTWRSRLPQGATFVGHAGIEITRDDVVLMYDLAKDGVNGILRDKIIEQMAGFSTVYEITGHDESIIEAVFRLRGSNINPAQCEIGSLRRLIHAEVNCQPIPLGGSIVYYPNYLHVPRNKDELGRCRQVVKGKFRS